MKKKILCVLLASAMVTSLMACGKTETVSEKTPDVSTEVVEETTELEEAVDVAADPAAALAGNRYFFSYPVEGLGDMTAYFHFYADDLGIGSVFYAGYAWNQVTFSGTYTVEKSDFTYEVAFEKDGEVQNGVAPYTITFFDWDGNEIDKAGYDGEYVYNTTTAINTDAMTGGGQYRLACATKEDIEKYADSFDGELGIAYMSMVNPEDETAYVTLNTNGTYEDMVVFAINGSWAQTADGEYTLTPDSETDNGATITLQEDGSYKYVSTAGDEVSLQVNQEAEAGFAFAGTIEVDGMDADLVLTTYTDGTCKVVAAMAGMELCVDEGTYEVGEDGYTYTFNLNNAGEVVSELGGDTGVQVHYVQEGAESVGDIDTMLGVVLD